MGHLPKHKLSTSHPQYQGCVQLCCILKTAPLQYSVMLYCPCCFSIQVYTKTGLVPIQSTCHYQSCYILLPVSSTLDLTLTTTGVLLTLKPTRVHNIDKQKASEHNISLN